MNNLPKNCLDEYRKRFQEAKAKRVQRTPDPPPRFDLIFVEGLARMNREEEYRIPPRDLYISEEVKARIRETRDE